MSLPLAKAALVILAEAWPQTVAFPELLTQARARLGRSVAGSALDPEARDVFEMLVQIYAPGLATIHVSPPKFSRHVTARPVASPLARWLATSTSRLPNLCHAQVTLENDSGRRLVTLLDGSRTRADLADEMRAFIEASSGESTDGPQREVPSKAELERNIENTLEVFARCALLSA